MRTETIQKCLQTPAIYHGIANIYHALKTIGVEGDLLLQANGEIYLIPNPENKTESPKP